MNGSKVTGIQRVRITGGMTATGPSPRIEVRTGNNRTTRAAITMPVTGMVIAAASHTTIDGTTRPPATGTAVIANEGAMTKKP